MNTDQTHWTKTISSKRPWFDLRLGELWQYRHLVLLFVRRDLRAGYKQTILGFLWLFIPPIISTAVFTVVFGKIAKFSSDGAPPILFYMAGIVMWAFFSGCVVSNANTFNSQAMLFNKIYFPRMVVNLANVGSVLFSTGLQIIMFSAVLFYYMAKDEVPGPNWAALLLPFLLLLTAGIALGIGSIASSITAKYRDLSFLLNYGMQLWMYGTAIIYPLSSIPEKYRALVLLNPISAVVETFRYGFLGTGSLPLNGLLYSAVFTLFILALGLIVFNRVEATAMDTV